MASGKVGGDANCASHERDCAATTLATTCSRNHSRQKLPTTGFAWEQVRDSREQWC
jgi:hypothetical protein